LIIVFLQRPREKHNQMGKQEIVSVRQKIDMRRRRRRILRTNT
jgi:hypothetical protein